MISGDHSSLIGALQGAGETVQLGIALAKIFEGDIDFASDIQRGDRFTHAAWPRPDGTIVLAEEDDDPCCGCPGAAIWGSLRNRLRL